MDTNVIRLLIITVAVVVVVIFALVLYRDRLGGMLHPSLRYRLPRQLKTTAKAPLKSPIDLLLRPPLRPNHSISLHGSHSVG
jgi:hypothetical protein